VAHPFLISQRVARMSAAKSGGVIPAFASLMRATAARHRLSSVMAGLVPAIHVLLVDAVKTWMPGTRPGMTPRALHAHSSFSGLQSCSPDERSEIRGRHPRIRFAHAGYGGFK